MEQRRLNHLSMLLLIGFLCAFIAAAYVLKDILPDADQRYALTCDVFESTDLEP